MSRVIILDSSPLALLVQRQRIPQADACRAWMKRHVNAGTRVLVPEIVRYELRRELLGDCKDKPLAALDTFINAERGRFLALTSKDLRPAKRCSGPIAAAGDWSRLIRMPWTSM